MTIKGGKATINLHVTTPPMKEKKYPVKDAQWLLEHNRYDLDFKPGRHDGVYGEHSAAATHRAKFLLGYPKRRVNGIFGPSLYGYLVGLDKPHAIKRPKSYQMRGAIRLKLWKRKQAKLNSKRLQAVKLALSQVGIKEDPPYSNQVKYSRWYGFTGAWCAMFASWCFSMVGRSLKYAAVAEIHYAAIHHIDGLELVGTPEKGDLCCMNYGSPDEHVGIFLEWVTENGGIFKMVSGNTGLSSYSNGGEVLVGQMYRTQVDAWVRVN